MQNEDSNENRVLITAPPAFEFISLNDVAPAQQSIMKRSGRKPACGEASFNGRFKNSNVCFSAANQSRTSKRKSRSRSKKQRANRSVRSSS